MTTSTESVFKTISELRRTEQDQPVRKFFDSLIEITDDQLVRELVDDILTERQSITESHLAYLLFVALQYTTDFSYDEPATPSALRSDLRTHYEEIVDLCRSKNIATNVAERYIHLQIILEILNRPVIVADVGSSVGLGLQRLGSEWPQVSIHPDLASYVSGDFKIEQAITVDSQRPDPQWLAACYLPEHREYRRHIQAVITDCDEGPNADFKQRDVVELPNVLNDSVDVIWTSSMMYQVEHDRMQVETAIKSSLDYSGIWIEATKSSEPADTAYDSDHSYASVVRTPKDWKTPLEVLLSPDDTVSEVRPGSDFKTFKSCIADQRPSE